MEKNNLKIFENKLIMENRVNFELAKEKKLIVDNDYKIYALIQSLYLKALEKYISMYVDLKKYDDEIFDSNLDFGLLPNDRKIPYHKISYLNLKYIYIRNFLFIEKLNNEDLEIFWNKIKNNNYEIDDTLLNIVQRTFKDIINNNYVVNEYKNDFIISYGPANPITMTKSDDLVINIQYGFNTKKLSDEEYEENLKQKKELISEIKKELIDKLSSLGVNVRVFIRNINDDITLIYE